jgi:hypothetical protein
MDRAGFHVNYIELRVYENVIVCECEVPSSAGMGWWNAGKWFIPFERIESIYYLCPPFRTRGGEVSIFSCLATIEVKVKGKNYIGRIPNNSIGELMPILERRYGPELRKILKPPGTTSDGFRIIG